MGGEISPKSHYPYIHPQTKTVECIFFWALLPIEEPSDLLGTNNQGNPSWHCTHSYIQNKNRLYSQYHTAVLGDIKFN